MGKRFSSFVGLNFGVWVSFEKMGHYRLWGGGVDVRTKKCWHMAVGLGFVFVLVSFNSFSSKAALRPGGLRDAWRDRVQAPKNLSIYGGARKSVGTQKERVRCNW